MGVGDGHAERLPQVFLPPGFLARTRSWNPADPLQYPRTGDGRRLVDAVRASLAERVRARIRSLLARPGGG